jgi:hypothetical protein
MLLQKDRRLIEEERHQQDNGICLKQNNGRRKASEGAMTSTWSDLDSPNVAWMPKRAVFASENGWMPFENEAESRCHCPLELFNLEVL